MTAMTDPFDIKVARAREERERLRKLAREQQGREKLQQADQDLLDALLIKFAPPLKEARHYAHYLRREHRLFLAHVDGAVNALKHAYRTDAARFMEFEQ